MYVKDKYSKQIVQSVCRILIKNNFNFSTELKENIINNNQLTLATLKSIKLSR